MAYITGEDRNQMRVVAVSLDELIDQDNPVRVIDAFVNSLNIAELGFKEYSGNNRGQAPYLRSDLLKLHIYGYLNKICSSRCLEIEAKRNLELMWLINSIMPDHGTISGFVKENKEAFHNTLRNLTLILKGWGLIDGKLIAIDGTKIRAQNSKHNCISESSLERKIAYADEQISAYLTAMARQETPTDMLKEKLEAYKQLKQKYETQKEELRTEGLEQKTLTVPDSRKMKNNGAMNICYNVQAVIDSKNHFAVDVAATNDINDLNQLSSMTLDAKELLEADKMAAVADTGYYNGQEIKKCVDEGIAVYIKKARSNNKTKENGYRKEKFNYNAELDVYICPIGKAMPFFENTTKNGVKYRKYRCSECKSCPKRKFCTTSVSGRSVQHWEYEEVLEKVNSETIANNEIYKLRRSIVEHPFGTIKRQFGYTYFLRKGIENADAESASMFIAYNLKRLFGVLPISEIKKRFELSRA